jgi:hypothetical protein
MKVGRLIAAALFQMTTSDHSPSSRLPTIKGGLGHTEGKRSHTVAIAFAPLICLHSAWTYNDEAIFDSNP